MHAVVDCLWLTGTTAALLRGYAAGVDILTGFLGAGVFDVDVLRTEAGLPNP